MNTETLCPNKYTRAQLKARESEIHAVTKNNYSCNKVWHVLGLGGEHQYLNFYESWGAKNNRTFLSQLVCDSQGSYPINDTLNPLRAHMINAFCNGNTRKRDALLLKIKSGAWKTMRPHKQEA